MSERPCISICGSRVHNLKNVTVEIPRNSICVITGLSGSGKSSLAFDTLYVEGQRRFVESLSSYARQFLDRMAKPDVDSIRGLPPAVAIEQRAFTKNPRSTLGTITEIYDYLRLLYGRIGIVIDKDTGEIIRKDSPESVVTQLLENETNKRIYILAAMQDSFEASTLIRQGFARYLPPNGNEILEASPESGFPSDALLVIDRLLLKNDQETRSRMTDSLEQAFTMGKGNVVVRLMSNDNVSEDRYFSSKFENARTKVEYIEPEPRLFSFNNPFGACPVCHGFGRSIGYDEALVIPDASVSVRRGAIHPFRGERHGRFLTDLLKAAPSVGLKTEVPFVQLTAEERRLIWEGFGDYIGIIGYFRYLEERSYSAHYRIIASRYRGFTTCHACGGARLRTAARQVFVGGKTIQHLVGLPLSEALDFIVSLELSTNEVQIVSTVVSEITRRLGMLVDLGLSYLTLDRLSHTLSGGESQRINLATALGSSLVGTLFVLDEPSIGLHARDTDRLISILKRLRDIGNTVVVVEHDLDIIRAADFIIDIGPGAGKDGGEVVYAGPVTGLSKEFNSATAKYLVDGPPLINLAKGNRKRRENVQIVEPHGHNLKGGVVEFPVGVLTVVTGVSGSGKSTLVHDVLYKSLEKILSGYSGDFHNCKEIRVPDSLRGVEYVDQSPIGKSSRSTPATFTKVFDVIRDLFASRPIAKQLGFKPGYFSFNVAGGRCEVCQGEGVVTVDMQFLPDVSLPCDVCHGLRYKKEVLAVTYAGKTIVDVLKLTVDEASVLFSDIPKIVNKLSVLQRIGLGYLQLGQPSPQLSGGESQRLKLSAYLDGSDASSRMLIFDEPTTGLHMQDVEMLLDVMRALVAAGTTLVIVEHNLAVIAAADHIIEMGPDAGELGGRIVAKGTPRSLAASSTHTGRALKSYIDSSAPSYSNQ